VTQADEPASVLRIDNLPARRYHGTIRKTGDSMDSAPASPRGRLAFIDWLRFIVVLSLAPFHAAISFTGMGSVYVYDAPVRDILVAGGTPVNVGPVALSVYTVFMDNWFMNLLFLVSGIGAAISLRQRTAGQFLGERCNRLLLPLVICVPLIVSVQTWLGALSFGRFSGASRGVTIRSICVPSRGEVPVWSGI
jgi:hypothetical protein